MDLKVWLIYLLTEFLLSITPGPAVMLVSAQGLKYGAIPGFFGSLGISSGNLMYFILSALGLGALILAAGNLFEYIKMTGAIYLIFTGILMIYKSLKDENNTNKQFDLYQNHYKSFIQGFVTQASNPKAIIFFVSLLPQFVDKSQNIPLQFTILGLTTIIMETPILMFYSWIAAKGRKMAGQNRIFNRWKDRLAGIALIGIGINLFFIKSKS